MRLQLPDVTLVVIDTIYHDLAALAVKECLCKAQFGAVQIYTDNSRPFQIAMPFFEASVDNEIVAVPTLTSLYDVMSFLWYRVPERIATSHALIVQWDSGIVNQTLWTDRFLELDYVGAPWGWHGDEYEVGNGGFSLRSRRLMQYMANSKQRLTAEPPEDDLLCRHYRPDLEREGFRWASNDLALQFSFERTGFSAIDRHFGYHGIFNWPRVFSAEALRERILLMLKNKYLNQQKHLAELLHAVNRQQAMNARAELAVH